MIAGIDLTGKRAIVTGASSRIPIETARALAGAGAAVTLAVRNLEAGESTAREITAGTANRQVFAAPLDLADRDSVATFVSAWDGPLDILANNAGVMATPERARRRLGDPIRDEPPRPLRERKLYFDWTETRSSRP